MACFGKPAAEEAVSGSRFWMNELGVLALASFPAH